MNTQPAGGLLERFKPTAGRWLAIVGIVVMTVIGISVASTGLDPDTIFVLALLAVLVSMSWAALIRPSLSAFCDHLLIKNIWSDLQIPWRLITDVDVRQTLQVYVGDERYHSIAVGKSVRKNVRPGRQSGSSAAESALLGTTAPTSLNERPTLEGISSVGTIYADYVVIKVQTFAAAQRDLGGDVTEVTRTWSWPTIVLNVVLGVALVVAFVAR